MREKSIDQPACRGMWKRRRGKGETETQRRRRTEQKNETNEMQRSQGFSPIRKGRETQT